VIGLLFIGFVAGIIAGISPCILPVLPVVLVGWTAPIENVEYRFRARRRRSASVVAGLVVSFSLITALGSVVLSSLGLPQDLLRNVGIALLILFGIGLLVPRIESLLERPFARLAGRPPRGTGSGFVLGLGLGLVFVPCAGPVLAAVSVLGATHHTTLYSLLLSLFFGAGAACPLFTIALAGDRLIEKNRRLSRQARNFRPVAGVALILMAFAITLNATNAIQLWIPSYTAILQQRVEGNSFTVHELQSLNKQPTEDSSLIACELLAAKALISSLQECGAAPEFTGITNWLNTPGDRPLTFASLRGHVVLVDFWTYSCINCERTLPHVEAWYARYHSYGLDVIGVQSPEFAFEHVLGNIRAAAKSLGVDYPIAVDNHLATWTAYSNEYWPGEYLIGANGVIRHVTYGEGDYSQNESLIRQLLKAANPIRNLPPATSVPDLTPSQQISPETYLGYDESQYFDGGALGENTSVTYRFPPGIPVGEYGLAGTWLTRSQEITAITGAELTLNFQANKVYLVLGGTGTLRESLDGKFVTRIRVSGFPRLYTLLAQKSDAPGELSLQFTSGIQAYDFTFG
jgi:cytochrome c biogenesis protein CcdA/thiol-disulfide isomerase/thioredoxin